MSHHTTISDSNSVVNHNPISSRYQHHQQSGHELIAIRDTQIANNVTVFYKENGGLVIERGDGCYMIGNDGMRYLDTCNNVACVGHSHPKVVEAGQYGLSQIQTNQRFLHPQQQQYVSKLLATFPPELNTVYMVSTGSEANDLALRLVREYCRRDAKLGEVRSVRPACPDDVIVMEGAYHGNSCATTDISPHKWKQAGANTDTAREARFHKSHVHVVSAPKTYRPDKPTIRGGSSRCPLTEVDHAHNAAVYASEVEDVVESQGGCGGFIHESAMGSAGQIFYPRTYLQKAYAAVRARGGVCIADEIQVGFGRDGDYFWMFEGHDVVPDIVTIGKPMGNGYPMAAVVCKREIADSFVDSGVEYFNTFGGNSVACYIGEAVLNVISEEALQANARHVGSYLYSEFCLLQQISAYIGDIRMKGLFVGVEMVCDVDGRALPLVSGTAAGTAELDLSGFDHLQSCKLTGLLVSHMQIHQHIISSRDENVFKIKPPLIFSMADAELLIKSFREALSSYNGPIH